MIARNQGAFLELFGNDAAQQGLQGRSVRGALGEEHEAYSTLAERIVPAWLSRRARSAPIDDASASAELLRTLFDGHVEGIVPAHVVSQEDGEVQYFEIVEMAFETVRKPLGAMLRREALIAESMFGSGSAVEAASSSGPAELDPWITSAVTGSSVPFHLPELPLPSVRPTGPAQFVSGLLATWNLGTECAAVLLGLEDQERARRMLTGYEPLAGRDVKDRIAHLYEVRMSLWSLFRDEAVENEWLREPNSLIAGMTPMDLLLEGSMENLLALREYVESLARR